MDILISGTILLFCSRLEGTSIYGFQHPTGIYIGADTLVPGLGKPGCKLYVTNRYVFGYAGQGGLLDITLDPKTRAVRSSKMISQISDEAVSILLNATDSQDAAAKLRDSMIATQQTTFNRTKEAQKNGFKPDILDGVLFWFEGTTAMYHQIVVHPPINGGKPPVHDYGAHPMLDKPFAVSYHDALNSPLQPPIQSLNATPVQGIASFLALEHNLNKTAVGPAPYPVFHLAPFGGGKWEANGDICRANSQLTVPPKSAGGKKAKAMN
jgi:hypothetical protein